ncbi:serine/threonine-protein kinase [Actinophytocola sp. NPDC049390]|uniref:serine/threonine-protein kinase n=1 Tax=Actinophytocola sp. NPDC049390 TaxID=3363894 RepID=UPI0037926F5C
MRSDDVIADRYRLVELIGHGGMGIVWLAEDLVEHRQVALKRPHGGGSIRADLEREAEIARRVEHPGAIEVFEVAGEGDDCWLVMEYFPSRSLAAVGTLDPGEVADIGAQVAATLAAAHAADVVHRDVTPGNVLVGAGGAVKVTDFGISAWRAATITGSGKISGTAAFVSPEVADGVGAKAPSDVFSLGATLFNAVEGTPPFGSGDPDVILTRIRANRREPMTKAGPLAPVLDAMLTRERAARPTAEQAKEMLDLVVADRPVPAWRPPVTEGRRPVLMAGVAVAVVTLLALALLRPWDGDGQGPAQTVLGDPHTADPCALMSVESLARFGDAALDADYGGFNRCDVVVDLGGHDADVRVELSSGDGGGAEVERGPAERDDDSCDVDFTLTDGNLVEIVAKADEGADANLCAMATAAADEAESVLRVNDEIPRRPAAVAGSLLDVDACMLLTPADLRELPGFANTEPVGGFGNWDCRWPSVDGAAAARVIFDKGSATSFRDGVRATRSGRAVYLKEEDFGEGTCQVDIVNREYHDNDGDLLAEVAMVVVEGDPDIPELCRMATALAGPVASRLPR